VSIQLIPQLPDHTALPLLAELTVCGEATKFEHNGELRHSQAYVSPTGGLPVQEDRLQTLRDLILEAARKHGFPYLRPRSFLGFEFRVAEILASWDALWIDGEASGESLRDACWTFLTLVVLPDVALWRWPLSAEREQDKAWKGRMLGGGRNAFQRIFRRVLSLDRGKEHPDRWGLIRDLREDDFSNILERPSLGSSRPIAVSLAEEYLSMRVRLAGFSAEIQMSVYREATKNVRAYGVVQSLDLLEKDDLDQLIRKTFLRREAQQVPAELTKAESPSKGVTSDEGSSDGNGTSTTGPTSSVDVPDSTPVVRPSQTRKPPGILRRLLGGG
jgi:hypothetical protein